MSIADPADVDTGDFPVGPMDRVLGGPLGQHDAGREAVRDLTPNNLPAYHKVPY
jgi:hypothetical protein